MRWLLGGLTALFLLLQFRLWFAEGGVLELIELEARIEREQALNARLQARNAVLEQQVIDLQEGNRVIEQRAREDLGLIKDGEQFFIFDEASADDARKAKP